MKYLIPKIYFGASLLSPLVILALYLDNVYHYLPYKKITDAPGFILSATLPILIAVGPILAIAGIILISFYSKSSDKVLIRAGMIINLLGFIMWISSLLVGAAQQFIYKQDSLNLSRADPFLFKAYSVIKADQAWQFLDGRTVPFSTSVVGLVDSGLDVTHPEFAGVNLGSTPADSKKDIVSGGHGTEIAGIIGANNLSATSSINYVFPQMNGVVGGVNNMPYLLEMRRPLFSFSVAGEFVSPAFTLASAVENLSQTGTKIINMSLGAGTPVFSLFPEFTVHLYSSIFQNNPEILFVVAAGNNGINVNLVSPANLGNQFNNLIVVGATDVTSGFEDARASFSNFGDSVNISAPGVAVYSPAPRGSGNFPTSTLDYDQFFSGTSASAPLVTGVAAILKSIKPELTPAQIKNILISTADTILTDKPIGPRLNALRAVQSLIQPPTPVSIQYFNPQFNAARYFGIGWSRNNEANFASYKIFRATHPNVETNDTLVATLINQDQVFFREENLAPGTYFYKVFVFNQAGISAPSNEVSGRIFDGSEVITRIPGVPEPGDANFPPNVAIPDSVFGPILSFDCLRSIFNFGVCVGPFTAATVLDEFGHISKFRRFSTSVVNNKFNGVSDFKFIVHSRDELRYTFSAIDDSYLIIQPEFGFFISIAAGESRTRFDSIPISFGGRVFDFFIRNSAGATNKAGTLNVAF